MCEKRSSRRSDGRTMGWTLRGGFEGREGDLRLFVARISRISCRGSEFWRRFAPAKKFARVSPTDGRRILCGDQAAIQLWEDGGENKDADSVWVGGGPEQDGRWLNEPEGGEGNTALTMVGSLPKVLNELLHLSLVRCMPHGCVGIWKRCQPSVMIACLSCETPRHTNWARCDRPYTLLLCLKCVLIPRILVPKILGCLETLAFCT